MMKKRSPARLIIMISVSVLLHAGFIASVSGVLQSPPLMALPRDQKTLSLVNLSLIPGDAPAIQPPRPPLSSPAVKLPELPPEQDTAGIPVESPEPELPSGPAVVEGYSIVEAPEVISGTPVVHDPSRRQEAISLYFGNLRSRIDGHKHYPYQARQRNQEGTVQVSFVVSRPGRLVGEPALEKKCRYASLNTAALEAVRDAAPYPPFPPDILEPELNFSVAITFSLFSGG
ncbi:putative TonB-dependent receptor [Treponema primitia ZAS-2]|uniref:Putative TonB-dependent receptor n=1 Tax=Treponema primitia (strain ATCC BAA-887 / DSM 12427 / ZAS-2) TaxID=545694 RepID=F5YLC2_TREPZ|nr:TonB family protein [Treponema primitia]AEF83799.1 putative TonB-dependent receptor [Treponema primitia ZAS-2]